MTIALVTLGMMGLDIGGGQDVQSAPNVPHVLNFTPRVGARVHVSGAISFDVLDSGDPFRLILVTVDMLGNKEIAFDGANFGPRYQDTVRNFYAPVSGGYHFSFWRDGGWPQPPTVTPYAITFSGSRNY